MAELQLGWWPEQDLTGLGQHDHWRNDGPLPSKEVPCVLRTQSVHERLHHGPH
jgi:hypothetical protein